MTDIRKLTEPKNKMVFLFQWEPWPSKLEIQKRQFGFKSHYL